MAGYIKGITIEFGANTTKLNKALNNLNNRLNKTQSELRQVNRSLKFNPGNTTLLNQKFKLLQQTVNQTSKKLNGLRIMQKRLDAKNVDKNSEMYRRLQREIIKTENQLKTAQKELKRFGTVGAQQAAAVGAKMRTCGQNIASVGRSASMYVTAPLTLVGAAAGRVTADFDSAMSKVQAISGATGNEFDKLRDKAREMGAKTKFSATESADALSYMAMAGWKTGDMLDGLEGIMNLAAASGEDLATTSDIVTDALTAFGLQAKDSGHFADVLAAASSNANTNVGMMGETFKYAAPIAGALGYSVEDTAQAIGLMANAGIKSSQAGTSLRSIMTKLSHDFTISGEAIGDVTIATTNADGSMRELNDILADSRKAFNGLTESEKASAAESLVGKNAMSGFLALMNASPKDISKLENAITNADGTAAQMADTMQNNFGGQLTILKSQLSEAGIAIGDTLVPFMEKLTSIIQTLVDKFNALSPTTKKIIVTIGIIAAAIGPIVTAVGLLVTAIGGALTFAPAIAAAAGAVGGAIAGVALPIMGVIAAIAAAIAIGVALYKNWDVIKAKATAIWTAIKTAIFKAIQKIVLDTVAKFGLIRTKITTIWTNIKTRVSTAVTNIKTKVTSVFNSLKTTVSNVWNKIKTAITRPINAAKDTVKKAVDKLKSFFPLKIGKIFSGLKLPHFSIKGGKAPFGIGGKGSKPSISVSWYKKAQENPYMFSNATLFGAGEGTQDEMLYGHKSLMRDIANAVSASSLNGVVVNVYGSDNMSVSELASAVEQRLIQAQKRRTQAWA